jgi:hypothetical protein
MAKLKHAIFLIHGAGRYGKLDKPTDKSMPKYQPDTGGWFERAQKVLKDTHDIAAAAAKRTDKFKDAFEVVPIRYDHIFERYRQAWVQQAGEWSKLGKDLSILGLSATQTESVRKFLADGATDNFGWNNILDVVLFLCPTVRAAIAADVMDQISLALAGEKAKPKGKDKSKDDKPPASGLGVTYDRWSVIAHSLGTAVFHESYASFLADRPGNAPIGPQVVCSLSNLAALLMDKVPGPYNHTMRPGPDPAPETYIEARHALDLIALLKPFEPNWPASEDGIYRPCVGLQDVFFGENYDDFPDSPEEAVNLPHAFWHYLYQPSVAGVLWANLFGFSLSEQKIAKAIRDNAPGKPDDFIRDQVKQKVDKILEEAKKIGDVSKSGGAIVKLLTEMFGA